MDFLSVIFILVLLGILFCTYDYHREWTHSCWGMVVTILGLVFILTALHSQDITYTHKTEITDSFEYVGVKIRFDKPMTIETITTGKRWVILSGSTKYRIRDYKPLPWNK